jgi:hypothetical protein
LIVTFKSEFYDIVRGGALDSERRTAATVEPALREPSNVA